MTAQSIKHSGIQALRQGCIPWWGEEGRGEGGGGGGEGRDQEGFRGFIYARHLGQMGRIYSRALNVNFIHYLLYLLVRVGQMF